METRKLNDAERSLLAEESDLAYTIVKKYKQEFDRSVKISPTVLDEVFALWQKDNSTFHEKNYDNNFRASNPNKPTATMIVYALGTEFGFFLCDNYDAGFEHVTDEYGSEIAVNVKQNDGSSNIVFPYSMIKKRIDSSDFGFLSAHIALYDEQLKKYLKKA